MENIAKLLDPVRDPTIETLVVISTAHMPEIEADELHSMIADKRANGMSRDEGCIVHTGQPIDGLVHVNYILGAMKANGHQWVLFDRDGDVVEAFQVFDW